VEKHKKGTNGMKKRVGGKNSKDVEARCKYRVTTPKISFENSQSILLSLGFNASDYRIAGCPIYEARRANAFNSQIATFWRKE